MLFKNSRFRIFFFLIMLLSLIFYFSLFVDDWSVSVFGLLSLTVLSLLLLLCIGWSLLLVLSPSFWPWLPSFNWILLLVRTIIFRTFLAVLPLVHLSLYYHYHFCQLLDLDSSWLIFWCNSWFRLITI